MDSIAFAFCDAVVGTIKKLPSVDVPFRDAKWKKALQDHSANRKCFKLGVGFSDGKWYYSLLNANFGSNPLLTTLVEQVGSKYLRFDCIQCVAEGWAASDTSKEELHALIKSLQPFLNFPRLHLYDVNSKIPEGDLAELLSSFAKINISAFYSTCKGRSAIEFAKQLMQQDTLVKKIQILARDALADEIDNYRATGGVVNTECFDTSLLFVR